MLLVKGSLSVSTPMVVGCQGTYHESAAACEGYAVDEVRHEAHDRKGRVSDRVWPLLFPSVALRSHESIYFLGIGKAAFAFPDEARERRKCGGWLLYHDVDFHFRPCWEFGMSDLNPPPWLDDDTLFNSLDHRLFPLSLFRALLHE